MQAKVIPLEHGTSCEIGGKEYPVTAVVDHPTLGTIPLANIPVLSDERWHELAAKAKAEHPERYEQAVTA